MMLYCCGLIYFEIIVVMALIENIYSLNLYYYFFTPAGDGAYSICLYCLCPGPALILIPTSPTISPPCNHSSTFLLFHLTSYHCSSPFHPHLPYSFLINFSLSPYFLLSYHQLPCSLFLLIPFCTVFNGLCSFFYSFISPFLSCSSSPFPIFAFAPLLKKKKILFFFFYLFFFLTVFLFSFQISPHLTSFYFTTPLSIFSFCPLISFFFFLLTCIFPSPFPPPFFQAFYFSPLPISSPNAAPLFFFSPPPSPPPPPPLLSSPISSPLFLLPLHSYALFF